MAAFSVLQSRVGYNLGYTLSATTPATSTMVKQWLNDAVDYVVAKFYKRFCWKLLHELQKEAIYPLTGASSYDVYTVIGNSTDHYAFISNGAGWTASELGVSPLDEISVKQYNKILAGQYYATESRPLIYFYEYDTATNHGNLPKFRIRPEASTETLYYRYLRHPTTMVDAGDLPCVLGDICDNILVNYATAQGWRREREMQQYSLSKGEFEAELNELIGKYEEPVWDAPRTDPFSHWIG